MAIFDEKFEIGERCKGVHCVDLGESFPTRIYSQKSASIQPRTEPLEVWGGNSIQYSLHSLGLDRTRAVTLDRPLVAPKCTCALSLRQLRACGRSSPFFLVFKRVPPGAHAAIVSNLSCAWAQASSFAVDESLERRRARKGYCLLRARIASLVGKVRAKCLA